MVAGEGGDEQPRELVADRLAEAQDAGGPPILLATQLGAVLQDHGEPSARGRQRRGVHLGPVIGFAQTPGDPSRE